MSCYPHLTENEAAIRAGGNSKTDHSVNREAIEKSNIENVEGKNIEGDQLKVGDDDAEGNANSKESEKNTIRCILTCLAPEGSPILSKHTTALLLI